MTDSQLLRCGLRAFARLVAAAALLVLRRFGALVAGTAGHVAGLIMRHHRASLPVLVLAAAGALAAGIPFTAAGCSLGAARHFAVSLIMIAAGAGFAIGCGGRLVCVLRH